MIEKTRGVFPVLAFLACLPLSPAWAGQAGAAAAAAKAADRADAYYHYSMGHLYAELGSLYHNRGDYLTRAIDHYKQALKADPNAAFVAEELSEVYIQADRMNDAVAEAEEWLKQNPEAIEPRRILGRIYARLMANPQSRSINEEMLRKAIEQYEKILAKEPKDLDSWLLLGRLQKVAQNSVESEKAFQRALELDPNSEEALTGLAMVYMDTGDSRRAAETLERAVARNPNPRTLIALAGAYEQMRDYAGAAKVLERALERAPNNVELKRALAQNLMLSRKSGEALKVYQELASANPRDPQSRLRISQIYREQRDFEKAWAALEEAKKLDPDNLEVQYNEVSLLEAEGKNEEAIGHIREILSSSEKAVYGPPERANRLILLERLGLLYRSSQKFAEAAGTFRAMAALDPDYGARSAAQIMDTWRQARDYKRATEEAEAAHKKYPKDRMIALVRASILADLGKVDQAVVETKRLFDGKGDRDVWLSLAQIYEKAKNYPEMEKALDEAWKLSLSAEEKESIHFMRGAMHERSKNYDAAESEFRKVLELNPDNASALNYLGYMLADRNVRLEEAHKLITRALEIDPHNGAYLDSLGWAYYRMDKLEQAEDYLRRALERMPKDPTINDHLGDVFAGQGRLKEAIAQWSIALKEWEASPPSERDPKEMAKISKKLEGARIRLAQEASTPAPRQP